MDWEAFYNKFRAPGFIPGYEIQNRLGGGAFGDVYKARKQSIGKAYAIKFLKIEDDSQREAVERELSQVRHFAAIDHPNLVTIEDMGTVLGVPFLIMGYAGEDTLARRLKADRLERDPAILYFVQACRGVLALHDRRLVHFDLKPSNVFLKGDVARVGDYGLSKLLTDGRMTLSFGRGTPQYMAPEMLRNRADHRADIYSLGVILYESLTCGLPFEGDAQGGLVLRETDEPPVFAADFPARLRPVVERCLRLDPKDRYEGVGELLSDIDQSARQGDSIRVEWGPEPSPGPETSESEPAFSPRAGANPASDRPTPGSREELRQTAADLARGAVEVARGVWAGIRNTEPEAEGKTAAPTPNKGSAEEPRGASGPASGLEASVESLGRTARRAAREMEATIVDVDETTKDKFIGIGGAFSWGPKSETDSQVSGTSSAGAGTIPVPPPVEGGLLGTVFSTVVLGLEVLVSLVANLLRGTVRVFRSTGDRALRKSGGFFRRAFRLAAFVVVMVVLGAVVMTVGMLFLNTLFVGA